MKPKTLEFFEPVKFVIDREYMEESKTRYCRVIGHGLNGDAIKDDDDYNIITLITPDGYVYRKGISYIQPIDLIDYEQIKIAEKKQAHPYNGLFENNSTKEEVLQKISPLFKSINKNNVYPQNLKHTFSRVGTDNFAEAVINIINMLSSKKNKFKLVKIDAINEFPMFEGSAETVEVKRHLILISDKKYNDKYRHIKYDKPFIPKYQDQTSFRENKVEIDPNEILLYFSHPNEFYPFGNHYDYTSPSTLHIAKLNREHGKGEFVPNEIFTRNRHKEYISNNESFTFLPAFIKSIMKYKFKHNRPNLDKEDYDIIVNRFLSRYALVGKESQNIDLVK